MKRYNTEKHICNKRKKAFENINNTKISWPAGHYYKSSILDCGHSQCLICHSEKILKIKTHKQKMADLNFQEQLNEI